MQGLLQRLICGRVLELPFAREGGVMTKPRIADRQPDSGKPTVRDERGACGNVSYGIGYSGTYSGNAETDKPLPKVARAVFLPDPFPRCHSLAMRVDAIGVDATRVAGAIGWTISAG